LMTASRRARACYDTEQVVAQTSFEPRRKRRKLLFNCPRASPTPPVSSSPTTPLAVRCAPAAYGSRREFFRAASRCPARFGLGQHGNGTRATPDAGGALFHPRQEGAFKPTLRMPDSPQLGVNMLKHWHVWSARSQKTRQGEGSRPSSLAGSSALGAAEGPTPRCGSPCSWGPSNPSAFSMPSPTKAAPGPLTGTIRARRWGRTIQAAAQGSPSMSNGIWTCRRQRLPAEARTKGRDEAGG